MIRPPNSTAFSFTGNMSEKYVDVVRKVPHVAMAYGTLLEKVADLVNPSTGIDLKEFNAMSGGFHYVEGGPFQRPDDMLVDQDFARTKNLHAGSTLTLGRHSLAHLRRGRIRQALAAFRAAKGACRNCIRPRGDGLVIYVKVDQPGEYPGVKADLQQMLGLDDDYKVYTMEEFISAAERRQCFR